MEITWLGHSAVKIKGSKTVYIDPFLTGNPKAVEFVQTKRVIPIHYVTFPAVGADPQEFKERVGSLVEVIILEPGETYRL